MRTHCTYLHVKRIRTEGNKVAGTFTAEPSSVSYHIGPENTKKAPGGWYSTATMGSGAVVAVEAKKSQKSAQEGGLRAGY